MRGWLLTFGAILLAWSAGLGGEEGGFFFSPPPVDPWPGFAAGALILIAGMVTRRRKP